LTQTLPAGFYAAKKLATLLDSAWTIPVINKKVGLDPVLSVIPYAGTLVGGLLSVYVLWLAVQLRLPNQVLAQLVMNILLDVTLGGIPFLGAIMDAMWRSNSRNMALLEKAHLAHNSIPIQPL
jgi:Domain of unknown function (DUF4112)